ncbi:LCP family protein [Kocuria massiliensis]|uniref:LCP family protein n=1 Tax=Kocuria massiliensis TaxID=1926282 RepID=UPI001FE6714A|nr:LCP family protein [Kocuria massiliensis]
MTHAPETSEDSQATSLTPRGRHYQNRARNSRRGMWLALCCVGLLVVVLGAGGFAAMRLRSNVSTEALNLGDQMNGGSQLADGPLDILVIGSDTRSGNNSNYGSASDEESGARSDVMMLMQISEDHKNVNVLSFPRDLMVDIPQCKGSDGKVYPAEQDTQINESLTNGGPGCTVATINKLTGVNVDHFMLVDFNAVKQLSSVVGGVNVCVNKPIKDEYSGLDLPAGHSDVEGEQALAFLRSRHGFGDGSDTSRIQAQQGFLASLMRKVKSQGTLSNPGKMYGIAEAVTQNVTVDQGFTDPATLVSVGRILSGVDLSKIVFATVPTEPYTYDQNKLQLSADSEQVFKTLQKDGSLADSQDDKSPQPDQSSTASIDRTVPVSMSNASGKQGRAQDLSSNVEHLGYSNVTYQELADSSDKTTIQYPAGYQDQAQELASHFGVGSTEVVETAGLSGISVTVGKDFTSGDTVKKDSSQKIVGGANGQTADQQTCQQAFEY